MAQQSGTTMVYLENLGPDPDGNRGTLGRNITKFDGVIYDIPVGGKQLVPYGAIVTWFGHPEARDISKKDNFRHQQFERMKVKYGGYEFRDHRDVFPNVRVTDVQTGEEIHTVVMDPEGVKLGPAPATTTADRNAQKQVEEMTKSLEAMQAQLTALQEQQERNRTPQTPTDEDDFIDAAPEAPPELDDIAPKGTPAAFLEDDEDDEDDAA